MTSLITDKSALVELDHQPENWTIREKNSLKIVQFTEDGQCERSNARVSRALRRLAS